MADQNKKNDDFVAKMPESANETNIGDGGKENDSLVGRGPGTDALPAQPSGFMNKIENSGPFSILSYCLSSISMTVVNKYVVSGTSWNLTFFYLAVQSIVCIVAITACKQLGMIKSLAPLEMDRIKKCTL
ncbi:putative Golgi GDP-mannose transporter [Fusarium fujikuroi]|nr:putative Golgi GDP-mannose transporter [Fusarium fujikuroi]